MSMMLMAAAGLMKKSASTYRFLRMNVSAVAQNNMRVGRLEFLVGATSYPTSNMTAANAPVPLVALASSENVGFEAFNAFDGGTVNFWVAGGAPAQWLRIDLGAGNGIMPTAVKVSPETSGGLFARTPSNFTIEGSNTGSFSGEQVTLGTFAQAWANTNPVTFAIP